MSIATQEPLRAETPEEPPIGTYDPREPLGIRVPVFGATGPKWSGKTMLAFQLAPGLHTTGHKFAGQSRTQLLDCELSSASYHVPGVDRVDVHQAIRNTVGQREVKPIDVYEWFIGHINKIPPGRFDVIAVDPATDLESGLLEWVKKNPTMFGATANQFAKMPAIAIAAAKQKWKQVLIDIATRCRTFYFTAHLKAEWKGDRPTGQQVAKGYESLFEVASLYLRLEREKGREGEKPKPPSAIVLKDRLSFQELDPETGELDIISILPERLPIATAKAIRDYVKKPVGKRKKGLTADEVAPDPLAMTDDERLVLQAEIADRNREAAALELARVEAQTQLQDRLQANRASSTVPPQSAPSAPGASGEGDESGDYSGDQGAETDPPPAMVTSQQIADMVRIAKELWPDVAVMKAEMSIKFGEFGVSKSSELTEIQAMEVLSQLNNRLSVTKQQRAMANLAANAPEGDSTEQQRAQILFAFSTFGLDPDERSKLLFSQGAERIEQLSKIGADTLLTKLAGMNQARKAAVSAAPAPAGQSPDTAPPATPAPPAAPATPATKEQIERLRAVSGPAGWGRPQAEKWCADRGIAKVSEASADDVAALIDELDAAVKAFSGNGSGSSAMPGN